MAHLYWRGKGSDKRSRSDGKKYPGDIAWIKYYENGQTIRKSLKTTDPKVARYLVNEVENRLSRNEAAIPKKNKSSLEQIFELYKENKKGRINKKTSSTHFSRVQRFIDYVGNVDPSSITEQIIKKYLDIRITTDHISHSTANHTISNLKTFFYFCLRNNYIIKNPCVGMIKYSVNKFEPRFLSDNNIKALINVTTDHKSRGMGWKIPHKQRNSDQGRLTPLVMFALFTGARLSELKRIDLKEDIDLKTDQILIRLSKSGKFRRIPLHPKLKSFVKALPDEMTHLNTANYDTNFEMIVKQVCEDQKIDKFRFHDLRHTFASMCIKNGIDMRTLSDFLGHSTIKTTEIYAHLYDDHKQESMKKLKYKWI